MQMSLFAILHPGPGLTQYSILHCSAMHSFALHCTALHCTAQCLTKSESECSEYWGAPVLYSTVL